MKKQYYIIVEWTDVFGESQYSEIPCIKQHLEKRMQQLRYQLRADGMIASFKVYSVYR